jgi:UDP-glucose 4-epimerase
MRIGITGASGFLGTSLSRYLADVGHSILALARTLPSTHGDAYPGIHWHQGDLISPREVADFVAGADVIIHLAWTNTPLTSNAHLPSDVSGSMLPTLTLLQGVREAATRPHIIFASSGGAVYGRPPDGGRPFRESDECRPQSSYGIQKLAAEHYLRLACEHDWATAVSLRIGNPYGVLLPPDRMQGFIGTAVSKLRAGAPIRLFGSLSNVRDYVHVSDVCRAFELAFSERCGFDVFNVGSGVGHSVEDIVHLIEEIEGRQVPVEREVPYDALHLPQWVVLDVAKAGQRLGWSPAVDLREGLTRMLAAAASTS